MIKGQPVNLSSFIPFLCCLSIPFVSICIIDIFVIVRFLLLVFLFMLLLPVLLLQFLSLLSVFILNAIGSCSFLLPRFPLFFCCLSRSSSSSLSPALISCLIPCTWMLSSPPCNAYRKRAMARQAGYWMDGPALSLKHDCSKTNSQGIG